MIVRSSGVFALAGRHSARSDVRLCPAVRHSIDTPNRSELIASSHNVEEIRRYITADTLSYLSEAGMYAFLGGQRSGFCDACFTGRYPVPFEDVAKHRQLVLFEAADQR